MKFYYRPPGVFYARGPFEAKNEREARRQLRELLEVPTLRGIEVGRA